MLTDLVCNAEITIHAVLENFEKNKKNFMIVIDSQKVIGVIVEGDIRRQLLNGKSLEEPIDYNAAFEYVYEHEGVEVLIDKFKNSKINFLPILDHDHVLVNVITKKQFHVIMLENLGYSPYKNFSQINESDLDHEIFGRPWGYYKSTILTKYAQGKVITVFPSGELSLQEHKKREEHWIVVSGEGSVILGESMIGVYPGKYIYIPKGCKHKIMNTSEHRELIFMEVQLGEYFGEDDILRYEDKYGRV